MLTPCTTTRSLSRNTLITSPRLPLSSRRPLIISTVSPLRIFALISILLQHFRGQRNDLHELLVTQFACYRPKDTRTTRVLPIRIQNHSGVVVEADIGAVFASPFFRQAHDHSVHNLALLDCALRRSRFNGRHYHISNVTIPAG